jgi:hypothetical protein
MINHLAPPTGGGVLEVCRPQFDGECNYEEARKDAARRARFCRRVHRPRPAGGLYAAEHHRRTAVGTSPRPVMAIRLIVPEEQLRAAGWNGELP